MESSARTVDTVLAEISNSSFPGHPEGRPPRINERLGAFEEVPLHICAIWGDLEACRLLVKAGAEIDVPGEAGCTPLHEAISQGHTEVAAYLLRAGANADLRCEFGSAHEMMMAMPKLLAVIEELERKKD